MRYIEKADRNQITCLPESIEDYVGEDNAVRVIDAFVNSLDMEALGFNRSQPNETGRPAYDPRDMLKLYIYGYFNRIRSGRKLKQECTRNIEVMYLLGKLAPDFRTITDFRKDNRAAIQKVFRAFVKICMECKLYQRELLAVDGTKFRAVNSKDNTYNEEILKKKLMRIETHIAEYLRVLDEADEAAAVSDETSREQIQAAIAELHSRKEKYDGYLGELSSTGKTQILTTDPEAHRMHTKDGFNCCYNQQT